MTRRGWAVCGVAVASGVAAIVVWTVGGDTPPRELWLESADEWVASDPRDAPDGRSLSVEGNWLNGAGLAFRPARTRWRRWLESRELLPESPPTWFEFYEPTTMPEDRVEAGGKQWIRYRLAR